VDAAVKKEIAERGWHYSRFQTNPTIFNNIVWTATVESDSVYYFGLYGFNDAPPSLRPISVISKNHSLLDHIPENDRAKRFLRWFTNGYFNVLPRGKDTFQVNDLRFGLLGDTLLVNNYVFPFLLFKNEQGEWDVLQDNKRVSDPEMNKQAMKGLWNRVIGQE
jgi:inner membrane protein